MAVENVAAVSATPNSISRVPRQNATIVMVRSETGVAHTAAQDSTPTLPESLSRYQVEAQSGPRPEEFLFISQREKLKKADQFPPLKPLSARHVESLKNRPAGGLAPTRGQSTISEDAIHHDSPPLQRNFHIDFLA